MVSVIIPNYNHAIFLQKRIESILNQTYQNFEIIIIDDASNDNSIDIINKYRNNSRIKHIIINKTNNGSPFITWKQGIKMASADLIWIAESDDYCDLTFLEKLIPAFNNPNIAVAFTRSKIIDENNNFIEIDKWGKESTKYFWEQNFCMSGLEFLKNYQAYKNVITNVSSAIFKKELFYKINDFPIYMKRAGDWWFWNQIIIHGDIYYHAEPLNYWRQHKNTTRALGNYTIEKEKMYEQLTVIKKTITLMNKHHIPYSTKGWYWLADRWISRFTYRLVFIKTYLFPPMPIKLKIYFYKQFIKKLFNSLYFSLIKKLKHQ